MCVQTLTMSFLPQLIVISIRWVFYIFWSSQAKESVKCVDIILNLPLTYPPKQLGLKEENHSNSRKLWANPNKFKTFEKIHIHQTREDKKQGKEELEKPQQFWYLQLFHQRHDGRPTMSNSFYWPPQVSQFLDKSITKLTWSVIWNIRLSWLKIWGRNFVPSSPITGSTTLLPLPTARIPAWKTWKQITYEMRLFIRFLTFSCKRPNLMPERNDTLFKPTIPGGKK